MNPDKSELKDDERELLSTPEFAMAIFEIEPKIEALRRHLLERFWSEVIQELQGKLELEHLSNYWDARFSMADLNPRDSGASAGIYWRNSEDQSMFYQVEVQCIGGYREQPYWGISRNPKIAKLGSDGEMALKNLLTGFGIDCNEDDWWVSWKLLKLQFLPKRLLNCFLTKNTINFSNI